MSNPLEAYMQSFNNGQPIEPPTETPPGGGSGGGGSGSGGGGDIVSSRVNNVHFNTTIFEEYRSRGIKSRTIKKENLANRKPPPLPQSKTGTGAMCLPWHTKGLCNSECRLKADHIKYTAAELKPLKDWCKGGLFK